ncbi:MAG: helix-turn-helix domain-containing protein [Holophagaceae bacterium]|nr:helix-turn-helix domain-containing protein [Holophagaceae bacterium]
MVSSALKNLCVALHNKRVALGLDLEKMSKEINISSKILNAIEKCDWSEIPSGLEFSLLEQIASRLEIDLKNHSVGVSSFSSSIAVENAHPGDLRRERVAMFGIMIATVVMLAWLLVPATDLSQPPTSNPQPPSTQRSFWQKPDSELPYPVLGEVFPESPITEDGVLISLRATDTCTATIKIEHGPVQKQVLRMSEPWKLRIKGAFVLTLDNAGVVAVEILGHKIQHGAVVGQQWSGSFDAQGNWLRPLPRPALNRVKLIDEDINDVVEPF